MSLPLPAGLARVDPEQAWAPWKPDDRDPWNARWAAHLFRRAGFGASPEQLAAAVRAGFEPTLRRLLDGEPRREKLDALLDRLGRRFASRDEIDKLRGWWLYAMLHSGHPLREKLTLFWHNHFATSVSKVKSATLMYRQNQLLRKHALGKFADLLHDVRRDPAMLVWLDAGQNVKGRPNENYAREVMELFSLGVGHYTEKDVREAARAFTGWRVEDDRAVFAPDKHDGGTKTILGQAGKWTGADVGRILLEQPAAARFLAGKFYRVFLSETEPPAALLDALARRFRASGYRIDALAGVLLRSRLFYSPHALLRRVKGPVEFVLGAVQAAWPGPARPADLVPVLEKMGQALFAPPNVKGWPGGRAWLSTSTLLARNNFAEQVAMGGGIFSPGLAVAVPATPPKSEEPRDPPAKFDVAAGFQERDATRPGELADRLLERFLPGCVPEAARKQVRAFLEEGRPKGAHLRQRIREAAHAVLCMAEYQLC
jgi:hypothetical protein